MGRRLTGSPRLAPGVGSRAEERPRTRLGFWLEQPGTFTKTENSEGAEEKLAQKDGFWFT